MFNSRVMSCAFVIFIICLFTYILESSRRNSDCLLRISDNNLQVYCSAKESGTKKWRFVRQISDARIVAFFPLNDVVVVVQEDDNAAIISHELLAQRLLAQR